MGLTPGSRLGAYEIVGLIGAGGMGEVYRAVDPRVDRHVALKVLPEEVASDPERTARFQREARVLASLNHPHIAGLFGFEEDAGRHFLAMELVEGETLAERIARGPLPVEEALAIALQMAEALEAAHERGIVHRDLKPANVKLTPDDKVKVLDFGLAKAMEGRSAATGASHESAYLNSPTLSAMATNAGVILGTASYMSPEQAKGFPADTRSDVFSFGVVLYEMLTGRTPFQGDTAAEVLASVLVRDADFAALPSNLNPRLLELLRRCLAKDPKKRWQAVGDLRIELESIPKAPTTAANAADVGVATQPRWRRVLAIGMTALVTATMAGAIAWMLWPAQPPAPIVARFAFPLPDGQNFTNPGRQAVAISPDGSRLVYVANTRLYLKSMSELDSQEVPGTEAAPGDFVSSPAFSPDGQSIAFWSGPVLSGYAPSGQLKRIAISGGTPVPISQILTPTGMSWVGETIIFGQDGVGIMRVAASGGKPEPLVSVEAGERAHGPQLLPGGEAVLFTLATDNPEESWDKARIVVHRLRTGERKTVIEGASDARYLPTGHLVYAVSGVVYAVPFDVGRQQLLGGAVPVIEGVRRTGDMSSFSGAAHFSVSSTGSLIYIPGPASAITSISFQYAFALFDRKGGVEPLKIPPGAYEAPRVSPNGKLLAFGTSGKEAMVSIYDLSGASVPRRLTVGGNNRLPIWSANGERVVFQSDREGDLGIFWQRADGNSLAERLTTADQGTAHVPESWLPGGDGFLFRITKGRTFTLWYFSLKDKKAEAFGGVQSMFPTHAVFSPNGRWVAYNSSNDVGSAGARGLWMQPFPATGPSHQLLISGTVPVWSPDGNEILYAGPSDSFFSRTITTQPSFALGNEVQIPFGRFLRLNPLSPRAFDITPDGRILGMIPAADTGSGQAPTRPSTGPRIYAVLNWFEELKRLVPTN